MPGDRLDRPLWFAFGLLFVLVAGAVVLPVRPLVWAFPLWAAVVLVACLATILVSVGAARAGWPRTEGEEGGASGDQRVSNGGVDA